MTRRDTACLCCKNGAQKAYKSGYPQSTFLIILYKQRKLASFFCREHRSNPLKTENDFFFFLFFSFFLCCKHPQRRLTEVSSTTILPGEEYRLFLQPLVSRAGSQSLRVALPRTPHRADSQKQVLSIFPL